jgi:hypothetical protein
MGVYQQMCHCRAGPVEAPLSQKFQNSTDSAAESKMCPMICTISKCDKVMTGVQTWVQCSWRSFIQKYQEMVSSVWRDWLYSKDEMWWEKASRGHWRANSRSNGSKSQKVFKAFVNANKCAVYHLPTHHVPLPENVSVPHSASAGFTTVGLCISFTINYFGMWTNRCR